jgi:predicted metalloprotease with PDZ domain
MIGSSIRNQNRQVESQDLAVAISGQWSFSDGDLAKIAGRLLKNYSRLTGFKLQRGARVLLLPLPAGADRWTAETRGNTVVLLIGAQASKRQLLGRLGVILTHEMFHLWIPNALSLKGDYDWFFEGFTLYQALRTAQEIGLIDFTEYLNTLGRVYDSYLLAMDGDRLSLLELSERRWTSSSSLVYDKGMLVAFLYDLELQSRSRGKTDFAAIYQQLFSADYSTSRDANEAVIAVLNRPDGMGQFSTKYIERPARINLKELLLPYGINVERVEFRTRLTVAADASDWQLVLLNALGYKK